MQPILTPLALVAAACLSTAAAAQQPDRAAWLADLDVLKHAIETRYANLAWAASPSSGVHLPALNRRAIAAITNAESDEDARDALVAFVSGFHDGHFSPVARLGARLVDPKPAPPKPSYSKSDPSAGCAAQGYATAENVAFSLPFESLPGFRLLGDGMAQPFRFGVLQVDSGATAGIIRIPEFETKSVPALCLAAWTTSIWNDDGTLNQRALNQATTAGWYHAIASALRDLDQRHVAVVIVDVGDNSGGDDSGDIAARLFTSAPLHSASLWMVQSPDASNAYFDEQLTTFQRVSQGVTETSMKDTLGRLDSLWSANKTQLAAETCPMDWVWREQRDWNSGCRHLVAAGSAGGPDAYVARGSISDARVAASLHWPARVDSLWGTWSGPLYVLTNQRTYSAAEMFAAVLQNNRAARTIGEKTGGDGCGFMDAPEPVLLPHSQMRFRIPNCVRLRSDGTDEVAGVKPDIPILPAQGENGRQRAQRVIDALRVDVGRRLPSP